MSRLVFKVEPPAAGNSVRPSLLDLFGNSDPHRLTSYQKFQPEPSVTCTNCQNKIWLSRVPFVSSCPCLREKSATWPQWIIREYYIQVLSGKLPWHHAVREGFKGVQLLGGTAPSGPAQQNSESRRSRSRSRTRSRVDQRSNTGDKGTSQPEQSTKGHQDAACSHLFAQCVKRPEYSMGLQTSYFNVLHTTIQQVSAPDSDKEEGQHKIRAWLEDLQLMRGSRNVLAQQLLEDAERLRTEAQWIERKIHELEKLIQRMADDAMEQAKKARKISEEMAKHKISVADLQNFIRKQTKQHRK